MAVLKKILSGRRKRLLGFPLFVSWYYCTFYSCVLVTNLSLIKSSERYLAMSLFVVALLAAFLIAIPRARDLIRSSAAIRYLGAAAATIGSAVIAFAFIGEVDLGVALLGGAIAGFGVCVLALSWCEIISQFPGHEIEYTIIISLILSIIIYFPIVYFKNTISIIMVMLLPIVSVIIANLPAKDDESTVENDEGIALPSFVRGVKNAVPRILPERSKDGIGITILFGVLWFSFSFFRTIAVPDYPSNRFSHYLTAFVAALVVAVVLAVLAMRYARTLTFVTALRWVIPMIGLSYALIAVLHERLREIAYMVSFCALVLMHIIIWLDTAKTSQQTGRDPILVFCRLLPPIGIGASIGCISAMLLQGFFEQDALFHTLPFIMFVILAVLMFCLMSILKTDDPMSVFDEDISDESEVMAALSSDTDIVKAYNEIIQTAALRFANEYKLTSREMEVLAYLLEGRSRPVIRDKMFVSLNTVNTYIKRIYQKTDVHSQQELLNKARLLREQPL